MNFFLKSLCFVWILYHVRTESEVPKPKFNLMALGHSGLLVFWEPGEYKKQWFLLNYGVTREEKADSPKMGYALDMTKGQYMISSLDENTEYTVTIQDHGPIRALPEYIYILKGKTTPYLNSEPAKPDMIQRKYTSSTFDKYDPHKRNVKIMWIPCGSGRDCDGKASGTHFLIKYRCIESRKTTIIRATQDEDFIFVFAGKIYEVVVTSVNGDFQTDSDPREIYLTPYSSSIRYVKLFSLNESSVMISWKDPKEVYSQLHIHGFNVYSCLRPNDRLDRTEADIIYENPSKCDKVGVDRYPKSVDHNAVVILNLDVAVEYIFFIIPTLRYSETDDDFIGTEYLVNYKHTPCNYDVNLPIAKPDIIWKSKFPQVRNECGIWFLWLPCGKSFDCYNTTPGYNVIVEYN